VTFDRIVCGVDPSSAGEVAARLAARFAEPDGVLELVTVEPPSVDAAGRGMNRVLEELAIDARRALERASGFAAPAHAVQTRLLEGNPLDSLLAEIGLRKANLAVVGSHGHSRAVGIALGSVATHLLHEAPCSVLIARAPRTGWWPKTIVAGVDGSPESADAAAAAHRLAGRFGSTLRFVAAVDDPSMAWPAASQLAPEVEEVPLSPVAALRELSEDADLIVVGSRALHGIRALGSVSERVAHEARCSVLVVRGPAASAVGDDVPEAAELDPNPVLPLSDRCAAVDARVRVRRAERVVQDVVAGRAR
jgi:nucleotide-binding universal stress UspA family protein